MTRRGSASIGKNHRSGPAGTGRYRDRFAAGLADDFFRPFARSLVASSIGIGTYLGECDDDDDADYAKTIRAALEGGINLVDTSANYRCQRSERVVGRVLDEAITAGVLARDEIIVCTKGGYIPLDTTPPPTREEYLAYLQRTFVETGIVSAEDV